MYGYEYGNARLRAMKSRLLSADELQALAEAESLEHLLTALTRTTYQKAIEAALVRASDLEAITYALRQDLIQTVRKLRQFFNGPEQQLVAIVLCEYDVHNLKTILRGLTHNASPAEIRAALLPIGDLSDAVLAELAQAHAPRTAIDLLVSMRLPLAQPLLDVRAKHPGADIPELELALDHWYFQHVAEQAQRATRRANLLTTALALDADLTNLLIVMRLVHAPSERALLRQRLGIDGIRSLFVGPGRLSFNLLAHVGEQAALEGVVELLAGTPYEEPLKTGLDVYRQSGRLSTLEKHLRRYRLRWRAGLSAKNPLGIGVLLSYLALKINEIDNLRWVVYGINIGLETTVIQEDLEFVT